MIMMLMMLMSVMFATPMQHPALSSSALTAGFGILGSPAALLNAA